MNKKKLLIFGLGDMAELALFYFNLYSEYEVEAFTVDRGFVTQESFSGLPVLPFDTVTEKFKPHDYDMFVALGYSKVNSVRRDKFCLAKQLGYFLPSIISPKASILTAEKMGENCFVFEDNTIQPFVKIGNNVVLWSGNHIGHHSIIGDHCFITSHVVVSGRVEIGEQCFLGVNSTLRDHIKVGDRSVIGAGTLILKDVLEDSVYIGNATQPTQIKSEQLRRI